ncbi:MAG: branched-chain amino acid ABC transporter permease [Acidimicrobiia bacterium]
MVFGFDFQILHDQFWTFTVTGLTQGAIYALVALGYTLVYGVLRLINFAHSEVFMVGTFGALFGTRWAGIAKGDDPPQAVIAVIGVLVLSLLAAMLFSGTTALVLERVAYRPLRKRRAPRLAALISAIGASFAISEAIANWRGRDLERFPDLVTPGPLFHIFDARITRTQVIVLVGALLMMIALDQFVARTHYGRGIRAVAQDAETATLMGVDIDRIILVTFMIGGIMAGGAGLLYMLKDGVTKYDIGFILGVKAFTAAVLGGIGNLRGALLGGLVLGLIENYGSAVIGSQWRDVVAFVVLVLVLLVRPTGLLGESLGKARA